VPLFNVLLAVALYVERWLYQIGVLQNTQNAPVTEVTAIFLLCCFGGYAFIAFWHGLYLFAAPKSTEDDVIPCGIAIFIIATAILWIQAKTSVAGPVILLALQQMAGFLVGALISYTRAYYKKR
jgi:uncharacterized membrane-anchored protein